MMKVYLSIIFAVFLLFSCTPKKEKITTPWGTTINTDGTQTAPQSDHFTLDDLISNGEIIMLTLSGPDTYYDYHGRGMGLQYMLGEQFAKSLGVSLRVEVCADTTEMIHKLEEGEGDIIGVPLPVRGHENGHGGLLFCGATMSGGAMQWAVKKGSEELAKALDHWFSPDLISKVKAQEKFILSTGGVIRHVYAPILNAGRGLISRYDTYFRMYAPMAGVDWKLLAAQCYQESCFDPNAHSWAGAMGLMQIMPSTAAHLGLPMEMIHDPQSNIAAAARFMAELQGKFPDVDPAQRVFFALACYNGGYWHIRDAMALARRYGRNPGSWADVSEFVLKLSIPEFYQDPVVKHGYMRGQETVDYVERIRQRWMQYRGM